MSATAGPGRRPKTFVHRDATTGNRLLTLPDAAKALGLDEQTVRKLAKAGELGAVKLGARYYVPSAAVDRLLTPSGV